MRARWFREAQDALAYLGGSLVFSAIGTIVTTALLLWIVWDCATEHKSTGAVLVSMLTATVSGRSWYFIGKLRGVREARAIWDKYKRNDETFQEVLSRKREGTAWR